MAREKIVETGLQKTGGKKACSLKNGLGKMVEGEKWIALFGWMK